MSELVSEIEKAVQQEMASIVPAKIEEMGQILQGRYNDQQSKTVAETADAYAAWKGVRGGRGSGKQMAYLNYKAAQFIAEHTTVEAKVSADAHGGHIEIIQTSSSEGAPSWLQNAIDRVQGVIDSNFDNVAGYEMD